jgi:hypothetical protein
VGEELVLEKLFVSPLVLGFKRLVESLSLLSMNILAQVHKIPADHRDTLQLANKPKEPLGSSHAQIKILQLKLKSIGTAVPEMAHDYDVLLNSLEFRWRSYFDVEEGDELETGEDALVVGY